MIVKNRGKRSNTYAPRKPDFKIQLNQSYISFTTLQYKRQFMCRIVRIAPLTSSTLSWTPNCPRDRVIRSRFCGHPTRLLINYFHPQAKQFLHLSSDSSKPPHVRSTHNWTNHAMTSGNPKPTIYPDYCHGLSPTIGKWCPLQAVDVHTLHSVGMYDNGMLAVLPFHISPTYAYAPRGQGRAQCQ